MHAPGFPVRLPARVRLRRAAADLPVIHPNDRVRVQCRYDNSESNPFMPKALAASGASEHAQDVWWGEETGDEMCLATVGLIVSKDGWNTLGWF